MRRRERNERLGGVVVVVVVVLDASAASLFPFLSLCSFSNLLPRLFLLFTPAIVL